MSGRSTKKTKAVSTPARGAFPFSAIVGQEEMKLALLLNVIAPSVGGVLVTGHRGTGKSTAVRALAELLPPLEAVRDCRFNCDPSNDSDLCDDCRARLKAGGRLARESRRVPVVELPLGATEDRVCGTIDISRALKEGVRSFEPGLLARANRGFLYIDEVNLLEDHLVDLLLDVAATGRNRVEREGVSTEHPSRFVLVGSSNPEEGELRPQLLDRFGLCAEVETVRDLDSRVRIVERREAFDRDPDAFAESVEAEQSRLRRRLLSAKRAYDKVVLPRELLRSIAELCARLGVDGHRGELTIARAARALAAFEGRRKVTAADVRRVAAMALRHRLRRDPLEQVEGGARIERNVNELFGEATEAGADGASQGRGDRVGDDEPDGAGGNGRGGNGGGGTPRRRKSSTGASREGPEGQLPSQSSKTQLMPPSAQDFHDDATGAGGRLSAHTRRGATPARRRGGARRTAYTKRGRYAGASSSPSASRNLALDATLRAAATSRAAHHAARASAARLFEPEDVRFKRFRAKTGTLFIFALDTSGSMAANRIGQAKGALAGLLRRSYVNRDRVALLSFRGRGSEVLLAPSASIARARRVLDALPVGGSTPLAAGLLRSLEIARRASSEGARDVRLVVFTDGRANVPLADDVTKDRAAVREQIRSEVVRLSAELRRAGVSALVVDTQQPFTSDGAGQLLSEALGGRYVRLK